MDLVCATCGFKATDGNAMADHMLETQHGVSADFMADLTDSGGLAEFTQMLTLIQGMANGTIRPGDLPEGAEIRPVDPDDPTIPPEVRAMMDVLDTRAPGVSLFCALEDHAKCEGSGCACACHQKNARPNAPPTENTQ